jgi:ABC-2 type transport system permease protein
MAKFSTSLTALIIKEFYQIRRDKSAILIAFILPIFLIFIFGKAISIDTNQLNIIIVDEDINSSAKNDLIDFFQSSKFIKIHQITDSKKAAQRELLKQHISAIITIPANFSKKIIAEKKAEIFIATDGSDPNNASFGASYARQILAKFGEYYNLKNGIKTNQIISIEQRFWFNEAQKADHLLNIGSIAFVLSITATLLTALVVASEWERGSMEYLIATKVKIYEIILSKILPYLLLGICSFLISFFCVMIFFSPPFKGSLILFLLIGILYLILTSGLGLLISTASKSQFVASQGAILASMVPTIMLSGLIYEIETMPKIMQIITFIVPAKYLINCLRTLFLMGNEFSILLPNIFGLVVLNFLIYFGIYRKTKKSIE